MIEVKQVFSRADVKRFINFQIKLYKNNPYYVPPIISEEINYLQKTKNPALKEAEVALFLAYKNKKIVGRIAGFVLHEYNKKMGAKYARFTRFDAIDDLKVANKLFDTLKEWAKGLGVQFLHGPLGANDLDREGLLIEGFDRLSTFATQYSYPYYVDQIKAQGFKKEIDWLEFSVTMPKKMDPRIEKLSQLVLTRSKLTIAKIKNKSKFIDTYKEGIFKTLDAAYAKLHGVVPLNKGVQEAVVKQFKLILHPKLICLVLDEQKEVVGFGLALPSISKAVQKNRGKLLPLGIFRLLFAAKFPKDVEMGLIAVRPESQRLGINSIILNEVGKNAIGLGIKKMETNLQLENNKEVQSQFEPFEKEQHKKRRCYIIEL